jgi:fatty acid desaturase
MIWAPLGMRFHALHHLFPTLPYHNMAAAHRRLAAVLPADHPYRQTESPSLLAAIGQLARASRAAQSSVRPASSPFGVAQSGGPRFRSQDCQPS